MEWKFGYTRMAKKKQLKKQTNYEQQNQTNK